MKRSFSFFLSALAALIFFVYSVAVPLVPPVSAANAAAAGQSYTAGQLAQKAVGFINSQFAAGQSVDPYTAYVLARAGQNLAAGEWVYNGTSLEDSVVASAGSMLQSAKIVTDVTDFSAKNIAFTILALQKWGKSGTAGQLANILSQRQIKSGAQAGSLDANIYSDMPAYYALGKAGLMSVVNDVYATSYILGTQAKDGSWGQTWDGTYYPDLLTTDYAVLALTYLPGAAKDQAVSAAEQKALDWLKQQQQPDGSICLINGMDDPVVDNALTIVTLDQLGVDPAAWVNDQGKNPVTYLLDDSLNANGSFGAVQNIMDAAMVLLACEYPTPGTAAPGTFVDLTGSFGWAAKDIDALAQRGVVTGVGQSRFAPALSMTRAEFVALLVRALGIEGTAASFTFKDVKSGDWYRADVNAAVARGIISGFPDGTFRPNEPVSRQEAAVILARALNLQAAPLQELHFSDAGAIAPWAKGSVAIAAADGLIKGYPDGAFCPQAVLNRAEGAVLIYQALMLEEQ